MAERVPGGDEDRAQGIVLGHERFEFWARLVDVHREWGFVVHDVVGLCKGLHQLYGDEICFVHRGVHS